MIYLNEEDVRHNLPWAELIQSIEEAVVENAITSPRRMSFELPPLSKNVTGHLLVMPAWRGGATIGLKTVTFRRDNHQHGERSHGASYFLIDGRSGEAVAVLDGRELTERRTAAVSVLSTRHLARPNSRKLLVVGTGPVARNLALAHAASRPLSSIEIHGRDPARAASLVDTLVQEGIQATVCQDLPMAVAAADIITCATSAQSPVILGEWLRPGVHVDLFGSFTPDMREVDNALMARADAIWVDTMVAAEESGDIRDPLAAGVIGPRSIVGELKHLLTAEPPPRNAEHITVFKSVGFATPDLAAASAAVSRAEGRATAKSASGG